MQSHQYFVNEFHVACNKKRDFKMTNVFGLSKWRIGIEMNCHKGEIGGTTLGGKIMNTVFYISSLGCLLRHSNEYLK